MGYITIKNRSASRVVYNIPDEGIRREFNPMEKKKVDDKEIEKLMYQPGGTELLINFLQILDSKDTLDALHIDKSTAPEYFYSEEDIAKLVAGSDNLDRFLDCLDFAQEGIIDLVKTLAVKVPMTDTQKIEALKKKTGFDVLAAIRNIEAEKEDEPDGAKEISIPARRVATQEEKPQRRVQAEETASSDEKESEPPKYKRV